MEFGDDPRKYSTSTEFEGGGTVKERYVLLFHLAFAFCLAIAAPQFAGAQTVDKKIAETMSTESYDVARVIQLKDSFGEVFVEGWDQPSIEISIVKSTRKKYAPKDQAEARAQLDRIKVTMTKESADKLLVTTNFPSRNLFTRPFRAKTNLKLVYKIKVPRNTVLDIDHDMGVVNVIGVAAQTRITNGIGAISLSLPASEEYYIDASSKLGEVKSDFDAKSNRPYLLGAKAVNKAGGEAHRLYLRVGIGEIEIKKSAPPSTGT